MDNVRVTRLRHSGVMVASLKRAKEFYCGLLGMKVVDEGPVSSKYSQSLFDRVIDLTYVKLRNEYFCPMCGEREGENHAEECSVGRGKQVYWSGLTTEAMFELYYIPGKREEYVNYIYSHHVSFTVVDIQGLMKKLLDNGVRVLGRLTRDPNGTHELFFATDYDGNMIEFVEPIRIL